MTKKKTLLEEGTVRHFMKLANLTPIASDFVGRLYEGEEVQEEDLEEAQGAVDKEDEHLGAADGAEKGKKQSMKDRRKEMRGEDRAEGDKTTKENLKLAEDDAADDEWGGNEGDQSETDPGHIDYEGEPIGDEAPEEGGDIDVNSLVRAIAAAIEAETGVSVDVDEEGEAGEEEVELGAEEEVDLGGDEELEMGAEEEVDLEEVVSAIAENVTKRLRNMSTQKKRKRK